MSKEKGHCRPSDVIAVADICDHKRVLKEIKVCIPIDQPCDGSTQTLFQSLSRQNPDAIVVVNNDSDCTMTVFIEGVRGGQGGNAPLAASVTGLSQITVSCSGPTSPGGRCSGTIDLDLTFVAQL
ncbi:S-Ena type endospore appendage [Paenibacillus yanchengensis]|uniref:S-Ena type endospore appendage n=1 Tax=Paenibacillus yanchengensis TaxID=2035833 RepID=A0ABW4YGX1_9BACL